jgi:hypothetical protein
VFEEGTRGEYVYAVYGGDFRLTKKFAIPRSNFDYGSKNQEIDNMRL